MSISWSWKLEDIPETRPAGDVALAGQISILASRRKVDSASQPTFEDALLNADLAVVQQAGAIIAACGPPRTATFASSDQRGLARFGTRF
jgi:hypothetical protein